MSYNLLIFDPGGAPKNSLEFLAWLENGSKPNAKEAVDPMTTSLALQSWYGDMVRDFPAMRGVDARTITPKHADYTFSKDKVFASFSWSRADDAWNCALALAQKHKLGFWDSSFGSGVLGPLPNGEYDVLFEIDAQ